MHFAAGAALIGILALTVADITGRTVFNHPVAGTVEITQMALVIVVFLAIAHSEDMGDHITIDLIYERVGKRFKKVLDVFADLITFAVMALMSLQLFKFGLRNMDSGAETPVLQWPLGPFVMVAAFGAALYTISTVMRLVLRLMGESANATDPTDGEAGGVEI